MPTPDEIYDIIHSGRKESRFEDGAEQTSGKPVIYVDPTKLDLNTSLENLGDQIKRQIDQQYPGGVSQNITPEELELLAEDVMTKGPFRSFIGGDNICIVNKSYFSEQQLSLTTPNGLFDLSRKGFKREHLKPFPGSTENWNYLTGSHEGEHCNQTTTSSTPPEGILADEIGADRAAIEELHRLGRDDVVQAWKDWRSIYAASAPNGTHATSIFLDDPDFNEGKKEHIEAAETFREKMCLAVAQKTGVTTDEAEKLRKSDPQKFADIVEEALKNGEISSSRNLTELEIEQRVAREMGLSEEKFSKLEGNRLDEVNTIYNQLEEKGEFQPKNPYIEKYISQYIGATRRLFVKDTSPAQPLTETTHAPEKITPTPEEITPQPEELIFTPKQEAYFQSISIMDKVVAKSLNLSEREAQDLYYKDASRYYDTVEKALKNGQIPMQTEVQGAARSALIAQKLGIRPEELEKRPEFLKRLAEESLEKEGKFQVDNPYLKEAIESGIADYRKNHPKPETTTSPLKTSSSLDDIKSNGQSICANTTCQPETLAANDPKWQVRPLAASAAMSMQM